MFNLRKFDYKKEIFSISLIVISLFLGVIFYKNFPAQVPSHWNINGEVDAYSGPFIAAFLLPIMMTAMYILFLVIPYLDPKKEAYMEIDSVYPKFRDLILGFLFVLYILTGLNGLGYELNIGFYIPVMVGFMFMIIGILLKKVKMNWFMGIRTPWTLSSEYVWNKTNKMGGVVFTISGFLIAGTALVPNNFKIAFFIIAIALIIFTLPIYSYYLYVQEKKQKK
ncbi:MAG: SdpI family protein [Patescibacteria group bacterium]